MRQVGDTFVIGLVICAVALVFVLGVAAPADAAGCAATGNFVFTIAEGSGRLILSADGSASMSILPGHFFCEVCLTALRGLTGTYRTGDIGGGQCAFNMDLAEADGRRVSIIGMVAFQGSVLLFQAATVPSFGPGLALRTDTLTGQ